MKGNDYKKHCFPFCFFAYFLMLIVVTGCGADKTQGQEVTIHYHADDGEFDEDAAHAAPVPAVEDSQSAKQKEKQIITLATCGIPGMDSVYQRAVNLFNNESEEYYVELTNYEYGDALGDARVRINVEIGTGGGPDVLMEDLFPIDLEKLDKGALVDLTPYLQESGITPEKYFPAYATITDGDRIYGVSPEGGVTCYAVDQKVLGAEEAPEFEVFVDRLLAYPEKAAFINNFQGEYYILEWFLGGSEDLWGVVDWESRTCDFTMPIFSKILEVVKRYGENGKKGFEPIMSSYSPDPGSWGIHLETMEQSGDVMIGYYFDDGRHPLLNHVAYTLVINANTKNLDGAYAFLSFVLSKKGQNCFPEPVHREYWEEKVQYTVKLINEGKYYVDNGTGNRNAVINEDLIKQVIDMYDDGKSRPRKAEKILDIVQEEAENYFAGIKTKEEVIEIIQNRVRLFLNE